MAPEGPCPRREDLTAWLQGELDGDEHEACSRHVAACPTCRASAAASLAVLGGLAPSRRARPGRWAWGGLLVAAAAILIWLQGDGSPAHPAPSPSPARLAADWIGTRLDAQGRWSDEALATVGAGRDLGVHAFAVLALARGIRLDDDAHRVARVSRAAHHLTIWQDETGHIGRRPGAADFDHPVATLALLEAWSVTGEAGLCDAAARAVSVLARERQAEPAPQRVGGRDAWVSAALIRARGLGLLPDAAAVGDAPDPLDEEGFWRLALGPGRAALERPTPDLFTSSASLLMEP